MRNRFRPDLHYVPDEVIETMYKRLKENQKLPSDITIIDPNEGAEQLCMRPLDLSTYKRIHVIGDVHGCYSALMKYLRDGIKEDEFYIFLGDYLDRGIENVETLKFLLSIYENKNVMLLEGNHERWIKQWAKDEPVASKEFQTVTKPELDASDIDKKEVRKLCSRFCQCAYFTYSHTRFFCCHGGVSKIPLDVANQCLNPLLIPTDLLIHGTGGYEDTIATEKAFIQNVKQDIIQIHGHRNLENSPIYLNERCYNLEGGVEFGKYLRAVEIYKWNGWAQIETAEVRNHVYQKQHMETVEEVVNAFRKDRCIKERRFGDISSFNFTKDAFWDRVWNGRTIKARGLYINTKDNEIVARGYDKFFNIGEMPETQLPALKEKLVFPVTAYFKENGFLGLLSYGKESDGLFFTTKSDPTGSYAERFRKIFWADFPIMRKQRLVSFLKGNNATMLFECIDPEYDPHIIKYNRSHLILLDIVHNTLKTEKFSFENLGYVANVFGFETKRIHFVLENYDDFKAWYKKVTAPEFMEYTPVEGFVLEDASGYMVKVKTAYYLKWKKLRTLLSKVEAGTLTENDMAQTDEDGRRFLEFALKKHQDHALTDIISMREKYHQESNRASETNKA